MGIVVLLGGNPCTNLETALTLPHKALHYNICITTPNITLLPPLLPTPPPTLPSTTLPSSHQEHQDTGQTNPVSAHSQDKDVPEQGYPCSLSPEIPVSPILDLPAPKKDSGINYLALNASIQGNPCPNLDLKSSRSPKTPPPINSTPKVPKGSPRDMATGKMPLNRVIPALIPFSIPPSLQ